MGDDLTVNGLISVKTLKLYILKLCHVLYRNHILTTWLKKRKKTRNLCLTLFQNWCGPCFLHAFFFPSLLERFYCWCPVSICPIIAFGLWGHITFYKSQIQRNSTWGTLSLEPNSRKLISVLSLFRWEDPWPHSHPDVDCNHKRNSKQDIFSQPLDQGI